MNKKLLFLHILIIGILISLPRDVSQAWSPCFADDIVADTEIHNVSCAGDCEQFNISSYNNDYVDLYQEAKYENESVTEDEIKPLPVYPLVIYTNICSPSDSQKCYEIRLAYQNVCSGQNTTGIIWFKEPLSVEKPASLFSSNDYYERDWDRHQWADSNKLLSTKSHHFNILIAPNTNLSFDLVVVSTTYANIEKTKKIPLYQAPSYLFSSVKLTLPVILSPSTTFEKNSFSSNTASSSFLSTSSEYQMSWWQRCLVAIQQFFNDLLGKNSNQKPTFLK